MNAPNTTRPTLTPARRKALKADAHHLKPVVMIGEAGLTDSVLAETDRALSAHGLIKVRVFGDDRDARVAMMDRIAEELGCAPVQMIGKLLVLYRPRADDAAAGATTGTSRKRSEPHNPKKSAGARVEAGMPATTPKRPRRPARAIDADEGASAGARARSGAGGRSGTGGRASAGGRSAVGGRAGAGARKPAGTGTHKGAGKGFTASKAARTPGARTSGTGTGTKATGAERSRTSTGTAPRKSGPVVSGPRARRAVLGNLKKGR